MTKQEFDNQKWYKSKVVYLNNEPYYAVAVWFFGEEIKLSKTKTDDDNGFWVPHRLISINKPEPTALDLIAAEREKQISKGYTVEHDAKYVGETCIHFDQLAFGLMNRVYAPEGWDKKYWEKLTRLPPKEKLAIAGAWVATELDIVLSQENKEQ